LCEYANHYTTDAVENNVGKYISRKIEIKALDEAYLSQTTMDIFPFA
jgi:hypothetical protein